MVSGRLVAWWLLAACGAKCGPELVQGARARGAGGARPITGHGQTDGAPMCNAMFNDESGPVNDGQVNRHEPRIETGR